MAVVTDRNLPDEVHRALRVCGAKHSCSTEAEIRAILELAVKPAQRLRMRHSRAPQVTLSAVVPAADARSNAPMIAGHRHAV